jgi:hypothetical protein
VELKFNVGFKELLEILHQLSFEEKVKAKKALENDLNGDNGKPNRQAGTMKGLVKYMAPDFDAPLDDFKDYM